MSYEELRGYLALLIAKRCSRILQYLEMCCCVLYRGSYGANVWSISIPIL